MPRESMKRLLMALGIILFLGVLIAGCSSIPSYSPSPPAPSSSTSPIRVVTAGTNNEWSLSLGCYSIVTGYAYNTGSSPVENVVIYLSLRYLDGTIRDSTAVYLGTIEPQGSHNYQVVLDRECGEEYSIGVVGTP